jgi:hypothetical protein
VLYTLENLGMDSRLTTLETRFDTILPTLATKADFACLRADIAEFKSEVRTELTSIKSEMHINNTSVTRWMLGTVIALFFGFTGLFFAMTDGLKTSNQNTNQANLPPIIINVPGGLSSPSFTPTSTYVIFPAIKLQDISR